MHGFDEFFGNLYHLNAEEEPERPYWPADDKPIPTTTSPRGLRSEATEVRMTQRFSRTGHASASRPSRTPARSTANAWKPIDDETTTAAIEYMGRQVRANKPFFVWMNITRMHVFTHVRELMRGQGGMPGNEYADDCVPRTH